MTTSECIDEIYVYNTADAGVHKTTTTSDGVLPA